MSHFKPVICFQSGTSARFLFYRFVNFRFSCLSVERASITFHLHPGTSWLQTIVWSILHYENSIGETSSKHIYDLVPRLEYTPAGEQPQLLVLEGMSSPRVMTSHLPPRAFSLHGNVSDKRTKIVYGLRNPKDMLVSFYYHSRLVNDGPGDL